MSTFTKEQVKHLGDLVRIALSDEEVEQLQGQLNSIADAINEIQEVDTEGIEPTANPVPLEAHLREDTAATPLTQEEALSGAPATEDGMFVVPQILGDE